MLKTAPLKDNILIAVPVIILVLLAGIMCLVGFYSARQIKLAQKMVVLEAISHFDNIIITRHWSASYGGVFVKQKKDVKPNPYLDNNHIFSDQQEILIKINPAWMTRQISELSNQINNYYYHITSLNPLNPDNSPDSFEIEALQFFEQHKDEKYYYHLTDEGQLDFMGVLLTEKPCLQCHAKQGYKVGDVRGGIRVSLPPDRYLEEVSFIVQSRNFLLIATPIIGVLIIAFFFRFMTILKRAEQQLITQEKMASLGGLVAGVAHEINTPVGIGIGCISHLIEKTRKLKDAYEKEEVSEEEFEAYLKDSEELTQMTFSNLNRAAELVRGFQRVAVDLSIEQQRTLNLRQYIDEVLLSLKNKLKMTQLKVVIDCPEDLVITCYPGAISQIITNLVINSMTHGFDKGSVGELRLVIEKGNSFMNLTYSDNGKGIEKHNLPKIFDPFFTTNRGGGNTGLGLQIVYNLITDKLHGNITCDSTFGQGVSFKIWLPDIRNDEKKI